MSDSSKDQTTTTEEIKKLNRTRRNQFIIVAGVVALLVVIPLAFFGTTTFEIEVSPPKASESARLSTREGMAFLLGRRVVLLGSSTKLNVSAPGFHLFETQVDRDLNVRNIQIELVPKPGIVTFSVLADSQVFLQIGGQEQVSAFPYTVELNSGEHEVLVTGPDINPLRQTVMVDGYGEAQEFELVPDASTSTVAISTQPSTATILVNGEYLATGIYEGRLPIGDHSLTLEADGYFSQSIPVSVSPRQSIDLGLVVLKPYPAQVTLKSTPSDASIVVNGEYVESTPAEISVDSLEEIEIVIQKPNYHPHTLKRTFEPGEVYSQLFVMSLRTVRVDITATPNAAIWINDKLRGRTPQAFDLAPNDVVEAIEPGFARQTSRIESVGPEHRSLHFNLVEEKQDTFNKAPQDVTIQETITLRKIPPLAYKVQIPSDLSRSDESQERSIELTRAYYLSTHEIRLKEFQRFDVNTEFDESTQDYPITNVSWRDAARFCNWLSEQEGLETVYKFRDGGVDIDADALGYRLPTEAEWEAAAQFDTQNEQLIGVFPWGNNDVPASGSENYSGRESSRDLHPFLENHVDNHSTLAPVGSYRRNANGFYDLGGNAAEWVQDFYESESSGRNESLLDPLGPSVGIDRLVKGASYRTHKIDELYVNGRTVIGFKDEKVGFRVARWLW